MVQRTKKKGNKIGLKSDRLFYCLLIAIPLLQFVVFYIGVNMNSFLLAFKEITFDENNHYVSIWSTQAFRNVFNNHIWNVGELWELVKVSFLSYFLKTVISVPLGLLFSYYISKKLTGAKFFRVALFMPSILSTIVMVSLYKYFVDNALTAMIRDITGQAQVHSLLNRSTETQYITILFYNLWIGFGVSVLMYANAMSAISPSIIDACKIDGATGLKEFWYVTLPSIFHTLSVFLVTGVALIFTDQFNLYSFYGADPSVKFKTFGYFMFFQANKYKDNMFAFPYLSALGLVMTAIAVPLTLGVRTLLEKFGPSEN